MISRRHFLARAVASIPVVLASAELAELLAPRKAIFLPPREGWTVLPPFIRGYWIQITWAELEPVNDQLLAARLINKQTLWPGAIVYNPVR